MINKWQWLFRQLTRRLWFRAGLLSLLAVGTALLAIVVAPYIPDDLPAKIGSDAVDHILNILASSLLAVTIFSLSTAVSAYGSATRTVTPRATKLLIEDVTTQNVLATFLGSFLYSLVGIIALSTGIYGSNGRVVLFAVTVLVVVLIVVTLLRWIDHLSGLGTVGQTTHRVEEAASAAMRTRAEDPCLGGHLLASLSDVPPGARAINGPKIGYVQHVDIQALSKCAEDCEGQVYVAALPGSFVTPAQPLGWSLGIDEERSPALQQAFAVGDDRSFDQDPRFGMVVLAEIASRALSPAMNDAGTAIDVIGRAVRVLSIAPEDDGGGEEPRFPRVFVPVVGLDTLFDDVFRPIARDGASCVEVQIRLQKAFLALAGLGERYLQPAARHARAALVRAESGLALAEERARVRALAGAVERVGA